METRLVTGWIALLLFSQPVFSQVVQRTAGAKAAANSGASHTGMIAAGQTFTADQSGVQCTISLNPDSVSLSASGGSASTSLIASSQSCGWTATSNNSWITVNSAASGVGNATVSIAAAPNTTTSLLSGSVTIGGSVFTVIEAAPGAAICSFGLTPASTNLPATGTSTVEVCPNNSGQPNCGVTPEAPASFTVTPNAACGAWTATSSSPEFLQITSGASSTGVGTVAFALLNNTHNGAQNYSISVASATGSATYSVTQAGSGDSETYREVYALYEQLLGRDPDPAGFAFWSGSGGAGLGQMADSFLTSPEAFNSDFAVMAAYQAATGTPPTYAQFIAAVSDVRAGTQTVPGLFTALIGSGYTATTLYQNLLSRAPASGDTACIDTGLSACFQTIVGYPSTVTPVGAANNEFQSTGIYHTDHTNSLYTQLVYYVTVSRDPDQAGFSFWLGIANSGGPGILFQGSVGYNTRIQILGPGTPNQGFIGSPEFQGLFAN